MEIFRQGIWNLLVLTPILGLNWIFGILTLIPNAPTASLVVFQYLFIIFVGLQVHVFHKVLVTSLHCLGFKFQYCFNSSCGICTIYLLWIVKKENSND